MRARFFIPTTVILLGIAMNAYAQAGTELCKALNILIQSSAQGFKAQRGSPKSSGKTWEGTMLLPQTESCDVRIFSTGSVSYRCYTSDFPPGTNIHRSYANYVQGLATCLGPDWKRRVISQESDPDTYIKFTSGKSAIGAAIYTDEDTKQRSFVISIERTAGE